MIDSDNDYFDPEHLHRGDLAIVTWRDENPTESLWLAGAELTGLSLRGMDLSSAYLPKAVVVDCDLRNTILSNSTFTNAQIRGCDLRYARVVTGRFCRATLDGVRFDHAFLACCDFTGSQMVDCSFVGCDCQFVDFRESGAVCAISPSAARAHSITIQSCDFREADLRRAYSARSTFEGSRLDGTLFPE